MSWAFANGPGDRGSIPTRVIPKTQKVVLNAALLNIQYYKVQIKEQRPTWNMERQLCVNLIGKLD